MAPRDAERAKAKAEAALEPLNRNGYRIEHAPPSVRTIAEGTTVEREPETVQTRAGMVGQAGTISRVRDRLAAAEEKKVEVPAAAPALNPWEEMYRRHQAEAEADTRHPGSNGICR